MKRMFALTTAALLIISSAGCKSDKISSISSTVTETGSSKIINVTEGTVSEKDVSSASSTASSKKSSTSSKKSSASSSKTESGNNTSKVLSQTTEEKTSKPSTQSASSEQKTVYEPFEEVTKVYKLPKKISFNMPEFSFGVYNDNSSGKTLPYRLYVPADYDSSKKYPVLFWLHGAGERGSNNTSQIAYLSKSFNVAGDFLNEAIILAPQCPEYGWWYIDQYEEEYEDEGGYLGAAMHLLYKIESEYSCDKSRIYVAGLSMGGFATWSVLERYSNHFAAGVPICGWGNAYAAEQLAGIPIWIYHGDADQTVSYSASTIMYNAIKDAGGEMVHLTTLFGVGHNAWDYALRDRNLFCWMFAQRKGKDDSYKFVSKLSVVSPNGETVLTAEDIDYTELSYEGNNAHLRAELYFNGAERLRSAYKNNLNKEFTVYYYGLKVYSFKPLRVRDDYSFDFSSSLPEEVAIDLMYKSEEYFS